VFDVVFDIVVGFAASLLETTHVDGNFRSDSIADCHAVGSISQVPKIRLQYRE
jgi:hypothetical protein